jgi:hypothetical protein
MLLACKLLSVASTIDTNEQEKRQQTLSQNIATRGPDQNSARTNRAESNRRTGPDGTRTEMASSFLLCYVLAATLAAASDHGVPQDAYEINGRPVPAMALMAETDGRELDLWTNLDDFTVPYSSSPEQFLEWIETSKETVANNLEQYYQPNVMLEQLEDMIQVANADGDCSHSQMRSFLLANRVPASTA